jgi:Flp pilus assembly protein TadG
MSRFIEFRGAHVRGGGPHGLAQGHTTDAERAGRMILENYSSQIGNSPTLIVATGEIRQPLSAPLDRGAATALANGVPVMNCRWRKSRPAERGAAAVEFALVLVPFLVLVFGIIQYGFYFYSAQAGSQAANAAVRQLSVGNCQDATKLTAFVNHQLGSAAKHGTTTITRTYKNIDGSTPATPQGANVQVGGTVTLTVSFDSINMHFPLLPFLSQATVSRTVQARVEDNTDRTCS